VLTDLSIPYDAFFSNFLAAPLMRQIEHSLVQNRLVSRINAILIVARLNWFSVEIDCNILPNSTRRVYVQ
jgi:hypothetical protein